MMTTAKLAHMKALSTLASRGGAGCAVPRHQLDDTGAAAFTVAPLAPRVKPTRRRQGMEAPLAPFGRRKMRGGKGLRADALAALGSLARALAGRWQGFWDTVCWVTWGQKTRENNNGQRKFPSFNCKSKTAFKTSGNEINPLERAVCAEKLH